MFCIETRFDTMFVELVNVEKILHCFALVSYVREASYCFELLPYE